MSFIADGVDAVSSFVVRSKTSWNVFVPLDNTTLAYKFLRMFTSHFMSLWKEVSRNPLAFSSAKLGCNNTFTHQRRVAPTLMIFPSGSSQVFSLSVDLSCVS